MPGEHPAVEAFMQAFMEAQPKDYPGRLPFSRELLEGFVEGGFSGRGTARFLREEGYAFSDAPFWEEWRGAVGYHKYRYRITSVMPEDTIPPDLGVVGLELDTGERQYRIRVVEWVERDAEYRTVFRTVTSTIDMTVGETLGTLADNYPLEPTEGSPGQIVDASVVGFSYGEGTFG